jgi:DNA-binding CsgD family transcriptional regulator
MAEEVRLEDWQILILQRVADGRTYAEIGRELRLAEDTIKKYMTSIRAVLGARNKAHAVHIANGKGLVTPWSS